MALWSDQARPARVRTAGLRSEADARAQMRTTCHSGGSMHACVTIHACMRAYVCGPASPHTCMHACMRPYACAAGVLPASFTLRRWPWQPWVGACRWQSMSRAQRPTCRSSKSPSCRSPWSACCTSGASGTYPCCCFLGAAALLAVSFGRGQGCPGLQPAWVHVLLLRPRGDRHCASALSPLTCRRRLRCWFTGQVPLPPHATMLRARLPAGTPPAATCRA